LTSRVTSSSEKGSWKRAVCFSTSLAVYSTSPVRRGAVGKVPTIVEGEPMSKARQPTEDRQEAFIQLDAKGLEELERAIKVIEGVGGRVLHTFPPSVIMASIPSERISDIRGKAGIESVDTDEISEDQLKRASDEIRLAAAAWNDHLKTKRFAPPLDNPALGLAWDAPGRLPPDPPPHIREMLRRREREIKSGE
jgi:hypothetical protein